MSDPTAAENDSFLVDILLFLLVLLGVIAARRKLREENDD